jgi:hypothetical protein
MSDEHRHDDEGQLPHNPGEPEFGDGHGGEHNPGEPDFGDDVAAENAADEVAERAEGHS